MKACSMRTAPPRPPGARAASRIVDRLGPDGTVAHCAAGAATSRVAVLVAPRRRGARVTARSSAPSRPRTRPRPRRTSPTACASRPTARTCTPTSRPACRASSSLDVRSPRPPSRPVTFPGARNLPHSRRSTRRRPPICRATRCSSRTAGARTATGRRKAAARLAALGFRVKEMLGGVAGWAAEGFQFESGKYSDKSCRNRIVHPRRA